MEVVENHFVVKVVENHWVYLLKDLLLVSGCPWLVCVSGSIRSVRCHEQDQTDQALSHCSCLSSWSAIHDPRTLPRILPVCELWEWVYVCFCVFTLPYPPCSPLHFVFACCPRFHMSIFLLLLLCVCECAHVCVFVCVRARVCVL